MTLPLRHNTGSSLIEMEAAEFARVSYNLRTRYATQIISGGVGAISLSTGTSIGTSSNTLSTVQDNRNVHGNPYPGAPGIGTATMNFTYYQNFSDIAVPTNFDNSYLYFTGTGFAQQNSIAEIRSLIIDDCVTQMLTGDMVGTYMVSTSTPAGGGWENTGVLYVDTRYNNVGNTTFNLYVRRTATAPTTNLPVPLRRLSGLNFIQQSAAQNSAFEDFLFSVLQSRLSETLRYSINGSGEDRGTFTDTRYTQSSNRNERFGADDYRSISTPNINGMTLDPVPYTLRLR